jgi:hypothetical protein
MNTRWQAFEAHIEHFPYRDICSKRAVARYINDGTFARDDSDLAGRGDAALRATPELRLLHLRHTVELLHTHKNFEIAMIDDDEERTMIGMSQWGVFADQGVLLEVFRRKNDGGFEEIDIEIKEPVIVRAFRGYFDVLWEQIRSINRDKDEVIMWLRQQIMKLVNQYPELSQIVTENS